MVITHDVDERNRIIGDNLRKYRLLKGLTQDELADGLCSVSQLSKVENGKTYIKRDILKSMASRLGVTIERIETSDALLEELTELSQMANHAMAAQNWEKASELIQQLMERSRDFGYAELYAKSVIMKCMLLHSLRNYDEAIYLATAALEEDVPQNAMQKMLLLSELGKVYEDNGNLVAAYDCFYRADDEFEFFDGESSARMQVNFSLARCHFNMKNYRTSLRHSEKAIMYASEQMKHLWRIRATCLKAMALSCLGQYEKAEEIFLHILKEAQDNNYVTDVGVINGNIGELFKLRGEYDQALIHTQRSLQICELLNLDGYHFQGILQMGEICFLKGELELSREYLNQVLVRLEENQVGTIREKAQALRFLAKIHLAQGEFQKYVSLSDEVLLIYEQSYSWDDAYSVATELGDALFERDDARAVEYYRKAVQHNKGLQEMRR